MLHEAVIYKTAGGCEPLQISPIKIIVLTECNPSVLTADKFGKLKKAGGIASKTQQSNSLCLAVNPPPFDKGGKDIVRGEAVEVLLRRLWGWKGSV